MRTLALAAALLAGLPVIGAEPVQVQLDVIIFCGPRSMLDGPEIKALLPKDFKLGGVFDTVDASRLLESCRDNCGAKLLAEPKLVTLSGRPAHFMSGGQVVVPATHSGKVDLRDVGTVVDFLPVVQPNGRIYVESNLTVRAADKKLGVVTAAGFVPGFNERSLKAAFEIREGQSALVCDRDGSETTAVMLTPTVLATHPCKIPDMGVSDHTKRVAAMLVHEYQQACEANNGELAAKLARMAVELDPLCFRLQAPVTMRAAPEPPKTESRNPIPAPYYLGDHPPVSIRPDPDFPLEKELMQQQAYDRLAARSTVRLAAPSEKEILTALKSQRQIDVNSDEIEFKYEKLVDRLDPPQFFPLVGQAQLHHCHWKCTVNYTESIGMSWPLKIAFKLHRTAVVYIDKDRLELGSGDSRRTHRESGFRPTMLLVEGQWQDVQLFNEIPDVKPRSTTGFQAFFLSVSD